MDSGIILDEGVELFGEAAFERVHLENRITELEEQLAQSGRIHEGLIKDKTEELEQKVVDAEEMVKAAQRDSKHNVIKYDKLLKDSLANRTKTTEKMSSLRKDYDELLDELCLKDENGEKLQKAVLDYERDVAAFIRSHTVQAQVAERRSIVNRAAMEFLFKFIINKSGAFGHYLSDDQAVLFRKINAVLDTPAPLPIWHDRPEDQAKYLMEEWERLDGKPLPWEKLVIEEILPITDSNISAVMPDIKMGDYVRWSSDSGYVTETGSIGVVGSSLPAPELAPMSTPPLVYGDAERGLHTGDTYVYTDKGLYPIGSAFTSSLNPNIDKDEDVMVILEDE